MEFFDGSGQPEHYPKSGNFPSTFLTCQEIEILAAPFNIL
jgi:hypothetical protein